MLALDYMPLPGGLPLLCGGHCVGGIGVSGVLAEQDEQVVRAGTGRAGALWSERGRRYDSEAARSRPASPEPRRRMPHMSLPTSKNCTARRTTSAPASASSARCASTRSSTCAA